jgi:chromosome segregation ATPase
MTPEELQVVQQQAEDEINEQGHSASTYAVAVIHQRDAIAHFISAVIWNPECQGCEGLRQRSDAAERAKANAEAALNSSVAEINRMRDTNVSLDIELTSLRQQVSDFESQVNSLLGENSSYIEQIATLQARIAELEAPP